MKDLDSDERPYTRRWRELVERRARQMDAAYAALNRTSADYWTRRMANTSSVLRRHAAPGDLLLQTVLPFAGTGRAALDVGAGAGRYALPLAPHVGSLIAVEPDAAMVPLLEQELEQNGIANVQIVRSTWQEADVAPADLVICAHVLYPIANAVPFLQKLDRSAVRACFIALRDTIPEPEPLGRLWQHYHHEPRYLQPGYMDAFNLLHEIGIHANVRVAFAPGPTYSYGHLDQAVVAVREHLILPEDAAIDAHLRRELELALLPDGNLLRLPSPSTYVAVLWWEKETRE